MLGVALGAHGCFTSSGQEPRSSGKREWACSLDGSSCSCAARRPFDEDADSITIYAPVEHPTEACRVYDCCLLQEAADPTEATCSCVATASCAAEAASRPGSVTVSQCPPEAEDPAEGVACAAEGENCRYDYLAAKELSGCCPGTLCKVDATGVPACRAATSEEQAFARECAQYAGNQRSAPSSVTGGPLQTNLGPMALETSSAVYPSFGPAGCVNGLTVTLGSLSQSCYLDLKVENVGGALRVVSAFGSVSGCPGITGEGFGLVDARANESREIDVTYSGASCDGHLIFESYCSSGVFDFYFHGPVEDVNFEAGHVLLQGTWCQPVSATGSCPVASAATP